MRSVLPLLTVLLLAVPARSQVFEGLPLGDISMSASAEGSVGSMEVVPLTKFNFYVVVEIDYADIGLPEQQETNGIKAWEARVDVPEEFTILAAIPIPEICLGLCWYDDNWIVGTGQNLRANTTPFAVVLYTALLLEPLVEPVLVTLGGTDPSSFEPAVPGWNEFYATGECLDATENAVPCLRRFATLRELEVRPGPVALDGPSWGALKASFEGARP